MAIHITPIARLGSLVAPEFTLGTANAVGSSVKAVMSNATLLAFDTVAVDAMTLGQSGSVGTATVAPRRDHAHALTAFDGVAVDAITFGQSGSVGSSTVAPRRDHVHAMEALPVGSAAKAWCQIAANGTLGSPSFNIASVTDTGTGSRVIIFDTDFGSSVYGATAALMTDANNDTQLAYSSAAAGQIVCQIYNSGSLDDRASGNAFFGDQ